MFQGLALRGGGFQYGVWPRTGLLTYPSISHFPNDLELVEVVEIVLGILERLRISV
jgi:hypothetical protein